jgi:hypothetical protein
MAPTVLYDSPAGSSTTTLTLRANYTYNFYVYGAGGGGGASSTVNGTPYAGGNGAKGTYVSVAYTPATTIEVSAYVPAGGVKGTSAISSTGGFGGNAATVISTDALKTIVIIAAGGGAGSNAFGPTPGTDGQPGSTTNDASDAATDAATDAASSGTPAQRITSAVNAGELFGGGAQAGSANYGSASYGTGGTSYTNLANPTFNVTYAAGTRFTGGGSDSNGSDGYIYITETAPVTLKDSIATLAACQKGIMAIYITNAQNANQ